MAAVFKTIAAETIRLSRFAPRAARSGAHLPLLPARYRPRADR